ncbi:hypothetical protein V8E55_000021 [Tylopilus felleus]
MTLHGYLSYIRVLPVMCVVLQHAQSANPHIAVIKWQTVTPSLSCFLFVLFEALSHIENYPIRTAKFLDVLGHPRVRKWEFDTLAAAATFQCLVLCRGIARPIRSIDIAAFLDMLVPDQRAIWKVWKNRVADRIVYETDIDFAPMIPTFGDERQKQLKDLLDEAQFGYDTYKRSFS